MRSRLALILAFLMFFTIPNYALSRDEQMDINEAEIFAFSKVSHLYGNYQVSIGDILVLKKDGEKFKIYNEDIEIEPDDIVIIEDILKVSKYREKIDRQNQVVQLIKNAVAQIGKPYVWGAAGPNSFDCSGLTSFVYRSVGIEIPRASYAQCFAGEKIQPNEILPGDLIFFNITGGSGHVGIYIGDGLMIHSPDVGDVVKISPIMHHGRIYGVRRHLSRIK